MTLLLHPARNGRHGVSGANVLPPVGLAEERDKDLVFMEVRALGPILRKKIVSTLNDPSAQVGATGRLEPFALLLVVLE